MMTDKMIKSKSKNTKLFNEKAMMACGGELRKKAKHRGARTLVTRVGSMHISLRSTEAKGRHSFLHKQNRQRVSRFVTSFSKKKGVKILSFANVGNHLHLHVKLHSRHLYKEWIRGLSSGLAMISFGLKGLKQLRANGKKFWDYRPFSRVIQSLRHFLNTKDYIQINILEGQGMPRKQAELLIKTPQAYFRFSPSG